MKKIFTILLTFVCLQAFGDNYKPYQSNNTQDYEAELNKLNRQLEELKKTNREKRRSLATPAGFCFYPFLDACEVSVGTTSRGGILWDINCCCLCSTMSFLPSPKRPGFNDSYFNIGWNFTFFNVDRLCIAFRPMMGIGMEETGKACCGTGMHRDGDLSHCIAVYYPSLPVFLYGICLKVAWGMVEFDDFFPLRLVGTVGVSNREGLYFALGIGF